MLASGEPHPPFGHCELELNAPTQLVEDPGQAQVKTSQARLSHLDGSLGILGAMLEGIDELFQLSTISLATGGLLAHPRFDHRLPVLDRLQVLANRAQRPRQVTVVAGQRLGPGPGGFSNQRWRGDVWLHATLVGHRSNPPDELGQR